MLNISTYWRHIMTVVGGAVGAQALRLLAAPLITRLCTPADMGAFGIWLGIVAVTSIGATLRMETTIIIANDRLSQQTCFGIICDSATMAAIVVTLLAAAGHFANWPIVGNMSWTGILTIGIATWLTAMMQTMLAYATSHRNFRKAAQVKILAAATIAVAQLILLYAGKNSIALMSGQLLGLVSGLFYARRLLRPPMMKLRTTMNPDGRTYLYQHRAFWQFSLPSNLLNALVGQLPLILIGMRHGPFAAGLFALTQRVLAAPISLIASSVLEVFKRQSAHDFGTRGDCSHAYQHTFRTLLYLGLGPSIILFLFSPEIFSWSFGNSWRPAGELAQILAPLYFLNFIASPLSYVFFVAGKQKMELVWQVFLFSMTVTIFSLPGTLQQNVLWYAIGYSGLYLIYLHMSYQCAQNRGAQS